MALESATYAAQLNTAYPVSSDPRSQGDDHLRLIKQVMATENSYEFKEWAYTGHSITRLSATLFNVSGDQTSVYLQGRNIRIDDSIGIVSSVTATASTAVNVNIAGGIPVSPSRTFVGAMSVSDSISILRFMSAAQQQDIKKSSPLLDMTNVLNSAADSGELVTCPPGIFNIEGQVNYSDYSKLVGAAPFWKRRTGYVYTGGKSTVFKYVGSGGSNSCVVRLSALAVGTEGSDFSAPGTDDLLSYRFENIHIDGNQLAEYPLYVYRAGNQSGIQNVTVERGAVDNVVMLGCFAAKFGRIGSFEAADKGFIIGRDIFGWGGAEYQCYDLRADLIASNNGTNGTFVAESVDEDGCGVLADVGRGSELHITSEGNDGRSAIIGGSASGGGPVDIRFHYLEGNGAGPRVDYRATFTGLRFSRGFLHPGSASIIKETIFLVARDSGGTATANAGCNDEGEWPIFEGFSGKNFNVGWSIDSNTYKFKVRDCAGITYEASRPKPEGVFAQGMFNAHSTITDIRMMRGETIYDDFEGDGSTTAFTLSQTCQTPTNNTSNPLVRVFINATEQTYTTHYTVSGTTLTFVSAPSNGALIRIEYANVSVARTDTGEYTVSFGVDQPDENYTVLLELIQTTGAGKAYITSKAAGSFVIETVDESDVATPADLGATSYIQFTCLYAGTHL